MTVPACATSQRHAIAAVMTADAGMACLPERQVDYMWSADIFGIVSGRVGGMGVASAHLWAVSTAINVQPPDI